MKDEVVKFNMDLNKWNIRQPLGDAIWVMMLDEPDADYVALDSGIVVETQKKTKGYFRIGKALKIGTTVKTVKEGDFLLIPPSAGFIGHKSEKGFKTLFISENAIIAVVDFDGNKDEFLKHQKENLFAQL